jgi:hypothetical protein
MYSETYRVVVVWVESNEMPYSDEFLEQVGLKNGQALTQIPS